MAGWLTGTIVERTQWNERLFSLRIRADFKDFSPGQFVRVALDLDGERVARPYSLVNTPDEDALEVFFNIVPEGPLSPELAKLAEGDKIFVSDRANGFLTVDEVPECKHLWFLATGTGVGPFLSILKSEQAWSRFERMVLVYSIRNLSELAYAEKIANIEKLHSEQFIFVPCITREEVDTALHERIPSAIEHGSLEARAGISINAEDSHIMMCGNSEMITAVSDLLEKRGMRKHRRREPGHLTTEKYH